MIVIVITETGKLLAGPFPNYRAADEWHDEWLDSYGDAEAPSVTFKPL